MSWHNTGLQQRLTSSCTSLPLIPTFLILTFFIPHPLLHRFVWHTAFPFCWPHPLYLLLAFSVSISPSTQLTTYTHILTIMSPLSSGFLATWILLTFTSQADVMVWDCAPFSQFSKLFFFFFSGLNRFDHGRWNLITHGYRKWHRWHYMTVTWLDCPGFEIIIIEWNTWKYYPPEH